jgi:hypothetical protein
MTPKNIIKPPIKDQINILLSDILVMSEYFDKPQQFQLYVF